MKINCNTQDTLPLSALTEFQGNLKLRDDADFEKIERSIKKHGFSFPFFVVNALPKMGQENILKKKR